MSLPAGYSRTPAGSVADRQSSSMGRQGVRMSTRFGLASVLFLSLVACATNPATGRRELSLMSEQQEVAIGHQNDLEVRRTMGLYDDRALQEYISTTGLHLAQGSERPNLPWHFSIVDVPAINAFALPGGYIYITRGILPFLENESQLACVLGHEVGHVTARHASQQYTRTTGAGLGVLLGSIFVPAVRPLGQIAESTAGVLFLKYGRDDELQADQLGVRYASRGGWDPAGMPAMLTTLGRLDEATDNKGVPNWLSTHPAPENRVERVQAAVQQASNESAARAGTDRNEYLGKVDGLVYGDNPDQGVVRGTSFLHPKLRLAADFPEGWDVSNSQSQVVAKQPGANVFIILQTVNRPAGRTIEETALRAMENAGFRAVAGGPATINGLDAFVGTYEGSLQGVGRVRVRAAHIVHNRSVFMMAGVAPADAYDRSEPALSSSIRSFRPLTPGEAESIHPNRINLYTAREGDSWQSIAERQGKGIVKPATLAIMNGHPVNEQPRAGERLKIVVG
jgi:predicted Zn-dependent protease